MNISKKTWILVLLLLLVILAGCKKAPTKTIIDLEGSELIGSGEVREARSIVDSQGNVLFSKTIEESGGMLGGIFTSDRGILNGDWKGVGPTGQQGLIRQGSFPVTNATTLGKGGGGGGSSGPYTGIKSFIEGQGAKTSGDRTPLDFYPVNNEKLLGGTFVIVGGEPVALGKGGSGGGGSTGPDIERNNLNLLSLEFWTTDEAMQNLVLLERENLRLSNTQYALPNREKDFFIEDERLCIQGGQMISNLIYYRSENSGCYGKGSTQCRAHFAEFPLFKSCTSLTDLRNTVNVPQSWEEYSVSCNFNDNFATLPSFVRNVNIGYSHCLLKNLDNSQQSVLVGFGVGNPTLEMQSSTLEIELEDFFRGINGGIQEQNQIETTSISVKDFSQSIINLGMILRENLYLEKNESSVSYEPSFPRTIRQFNGTQCDPSIGTEESSSFLLCQLYKEVPMNTELESVAQWYESQGNTVLARYPGTVHTGSHEDKVSSNYLFLESKTVSNLEFIKYEVTLLENLKYYVVLNPQTSWFAVSDYNFDIEEVVRSGHFNSSYTPERLFVRKNINGLTYTLTEESETLFYKSGNIFVPENPYTTLPIYLLRVEGASSNMCEELFGLYSYESSSELTYGKHLSCTVQGGTLNAMLSEKFFSQRYSQSNQMGAGYLLMRNILFSTNDNSLESSTSQGSFIASQSSQSSSSESLEDEILEVEADPSPFVLDLQRVAVGLPNTGVIESRFDTRFDLTGDGQITAQDALDALRAESGLQPSHLSIVEVLEVRDLWLSLQD